MFDATAEESWIYANRILAGSRFRYLVKVSESEYELVFVDPHEVEHRIRFSSCLNQTTTIIKAVLKFQMP